MPPRILPLLQRKFEEIRSRNWGRRLRHDAPPSMKQLLKPEDNESEVDNCEFKWSKSSPNNSLASQKLQKIPEKKSAKVAPVLLDDHKIEEQKNKEENKLENCIEKQKEKESENVAKVVPVYIGGVFALEQAAHGEEEDEDPEDGMRNINYQMGPASPSFRIYCQEADNDESDYDSAYSTDENINHKKMSSIDSSADSIADNNGQDTKTKKKAKRLRMKNPLPVDRCVKNLLNVRGCCKSGCGGHDRATLASC